MRECMAAILSLGGLPAAAVVDEEGRLFGGEVRFETIQTISIS